MEEKLELKVEDSRSRRPSRDRHQYQRYHQYSPRPSFSPPPRCPPLEVRLEPRDQTVAQGSPALLQCSVTAPGPGQTYRYHWEKVREEISEERTRVVPGPGWSQLTLTSVEVEDRGLYVCLVTSPCGGRARASSILEVEQREPPSLEIYPASLQTVGSGDSVLFQCR